MLQISPANSRSIPAVADHNIAPMAEEDGNAEATTVVVCDESAIENAATADNAWRLDQAAFRHANRHFNGTRFTTIALPTRITN